MKILYIDDEPDILEQAKIFLEKADDRFNVRTSLSGEKALELIEGDEDFSIIVSDYKMTGMDGLEVLKKLREKGVEIPFIFLTGKGNRDIAKKALNSGADEYIQKKGSPRKLYDNLSKTMQEIIKKTK